MKPGPRALHRWWAKRRGHAWITCRCGVEFGRHEAAFQRLTPRAEVARCSRSCAEEAA